MTSLQRGAYSDDFNDENRATLEFCTGRVSPSTAISLAIIATLLAIRFADRSPLMTVPHVLVMDVLFYGVQPHVGLDKGTLGVNVVDCVDDNGRDGGSSKATRMKETLGSGGGRQGSI